MGGKIPHYGDHGLLPPYSHSMAELAHPLFFSFRHPWHSSRSVMGDHAWAQFIRLRYGYAQLVKQPTRNKAVLDKIWTNMGAVYGEPSVLSVLGSSDHDMVLLSPSDNTTLDNGPLAQPWRRLSPHGDSRRGMAKPSPWRDFYDGDIVATATLIAIWRHPSPWRPYGDTHRHLATGVAKARQPR